MKEIEIDENDEVISFYPFLESDIMLSLLATQGKARNQKWEIQRKYNF